MPARTFVSSLILLIVPLVLGGCDSNDDSCQDPPATVAPGSFALRYEEDGGRCLSISGEFAQFEIRPALFSRGDIFAARLVPDDDVGGAETSFLQFLAIGTEPLPVGTYEVANLFERSDVPNSPPAGDVRFIEQTEKVSIGFVLNRAPAFSRGGQFVVTRSNADVVEGRFTTTLSTRDGASSEAEGTFSLERGQGDIGFGYF